MTNEEQQQYEYTTTNLKNNKTRKTSLEVFPSKVTPLGAFDFKN